MVAVEFPEQRLRRAGVKRQPMLQVMQAWSAADEQARWVWQQWVSTVSDADLRGNPGGAQLAEAPRTVPVAPTQEPVVDPTLVTVPDEPPAAPDVPDFTDALHSVDTAEAYLLEHPEHAEALGAAEVAGKNRKMIARAVAEIIDARG